MEKVTVDTILNFMKESVENKVPLPPSTWLDAADKLNTLIGDEYDKLAELDYEVANIKLGFLESQGKKNVSEAKLKTEATTQYRDLAKQTYRIKQIEEFIRLNKLRTRLKMEEAKNNF